jgi:hypothetical protein
VDRPGYSGGLLGVFPGKLRRQDKTDEAPIAIFHAEINPVTIKRDFSRNPGR